MYLKLLPAYRRQAKEDSLFFFVAEAFIPTFYQSPQLLNYFLTYANLKSSYEVLIYGL
jgi:hypothetical protein